VTSSPGVNAERILVVDDEPDIVALVAFHLVKAGYRVATAANGPDALAQARQDPPALIVLDLMLPGMSGFGKRQATRRRSRCAGGR
jgi:two-component system phosphate regulon response regulator PhoB